MTEWLASDHHLGHENIIRFTDANGKRIREFDDVDHHDETIIARHNELVMPKDRVYFMGDVAINRRHIQKVGRMNGRKILIKGNHDIFNLEDYVDWFDDIRAYKVYPKHGLIVSHIPVHTYQLEGRWKANAHGHTHQNKVKRAESHVDDPRYINLCMEHTDFRPLNLDDVLKRIPT